MRQETTNVSRREFLQGVSLLAAGGVLAACAPKTEEPAAPEPEDEEPEATAEPAEAEAIELQLMWETGFSGGRLEAVENYSETNPDVDITLVYAEWDEFEPKLMAMYAGGVAPDILGTGGSNPHAERFVRGMVIGLNDYMAAETELADDLWPSTVDTYTIRGELIGMPMNTNFPGIYYNANMFDAAGLDYPPVDWEDTSWTWADMIDAAKTLTQDKNGDGKLDEFGVELMSYNAPYYYTRLWGEDVISDEDYEAGVLHKWQTDKPEVYDAFVEGIQAKQDAMYEAEVSPSPSTLDALQEMGRLLTTGVMGMIYTGSWAISGDFMEGDRFGAAAVPLGGEGGSGTRGDSLWINPMQIVSTTEYPDECFAFTKYWVSDPDCLSTKMPGRVSVPSVQSAFDDYMEDWSENEFMAISTENMRKHIEGALSTATTDDPYHIVVGWAIIADIFGAELEPVWLGNKTAKEAADTMIPMINDKLEQALAELEIE